MAKFQNLPGLFVTKLDGGVRVVNAQPNNVTLILGTSPAGVTEKVYLVGNTTDAQSVFDPNATGDGTLLSTMNEAISGGAPFTALYRVGAQPSYLDFVGPYRIEALYGGANGLDGFTFYYYHATNHLKVFDASNGALIYDNNPADPVDYGLVKVSLAHPDLSNSTEFAAFNDANMTPLSYSDWKTYVEANGLNNADISGTLVHGTNTITLTTKPDVLQEGTILSLTGTANSGMYEVLAITGSDGNWTLTVRPYTYVSDRSLNSTDLAFTFADNAGADDSFTDGKVLGGIYDGDSGLSMTNEQKFEAMQKAYFNLESAQIDYMVAGDIYLDAPNIVKNDGSVEVPSYSDFLGLVNYEVVGNTISFMWDNNNDGVAERLSNPYDIGLHGQDAADFVANKNIAASTILEGESTTATFHEANFAYEMSKYLHNLSENDNEAIGFIGVTAPNTMSRFDIDTWVGRMPVYDPATGDITRDGTGLLGNKFMVGTLNHAPGFYLTSTGYLDGAPLKDANGHKYDLGKYISVVAHWITMSTLAVTKPYTVSGAAFYAGFVAGLPVNEAPTNKSINQNATVAFALHKRTLDKLTKFHYVTLTTDTRGIVKVVDSPMAATEDSDWKRLMTVRIVAELIDASRATAEPYIGNIFNAEVRGALEQELNALVLDRQKAGWLRYGKVSVTQTHNQQIAGTADVHYDLKVNGELRRLNFTIALHA